ncbi:hypothetical protein GCM10010520_50730 [Rhizobium viscosum]|uniref:Uncharacterized protein n=1 Tax=Rhizobium viscosum TaxID=1673 RepID=A0ABR9IZG4_RHIVS|nr:hypothetical protein [Rhizobium viscosum]MBE1508605.1 hypothetical protein [Rhizobium viscosum]
MSLLNLLSLQDDEIDTVTTVVRKWCSDHHVPIDGERGRAAMSEAVRLTMAGEKSAPMLAEALSRHMRLDQFKRRRD